MEIRTETVYRLPGELITSLEDFYKLIGEVINGPGGYFGKCLDSFDDCLYGGFGTPETFTIQWLSSDVSKRFLGYEETVRQLEKRLAECHPSARESIEEQLVQAKLRQGPTVFDWLVDIIRAHENVRLDLC